MPRLGPALCTAVIAVGLAHTDRVRAQTSLNEILTPLLDRYKLPAIAAAAVVNGQIVASGAVGTRRFGADIPVTIDDRFHIGSDTKSMTALLAGMLVDAGKLRWDSTLPDVFPELSEKIDADLKTATLEQFLSHTSGIPGDNLGFTLLLKQSWTQLGNLDDVRRWMVSQWAPKPLSAKPGTKFAYANMNYVIAGAMIERQAGKTWEELITDRIFVPLGLKSAGLGPQSSLGKIDAPLGHERHDGKLRALLAGPNADNPPVMGPAGCANMSILDFARWAGWNAGQGKRGPALVKAETVLKLHSPVIPMSDKTAEPAELSRKYGLGWGELKVDWAPEPLLYHGGSNTMNFAHIWIDSKHDFAIVAATNVGGKESDGALLELTKQIYAKFAPAKVGEKK